MQTVYVIIPVFNAEKYLHRAVDSICYQKHEGIELKLVLVNDGSNDSSAEICDALAAQFENMHVIHKNNGGVSSARNIGIEYVLSDTDEDSGYIAFLDADDLWHTNFFDMDLVQVIEQSQYDILGFNMITCDEGVQHFSKANLYEHQVFSGGNQSLWNLHDSFASNFYKIALLRKWGIRFFTNCRYSEDKYFKMQCSFFAEEIAVFPKILYLYRQNRQSAMGQSKTVSPIDYYQPIVNGWLQNDEFINNWASVTGKTICAGHTLASIYLLDMAREHYMQWRPDREIRQAVEKHPHYAHLKSLRAIDSNDTDYKDKELFVKHPVVFAWKHRLIGIVYYSLRAMLKIPFVRMFNDKRKFPLNHMP